MQHSKLIADDYRVLLCQSVASDRLRTQADGNLIPFCEGDALRRVRSAHNVHSSITLRQRRDDEIRRTARLITVGVLSSDSSAL